MIDKTQTPNIVAKRVDRLPLGHYLELRTYKRNRGIVIVKRGEDDLLVLEKGYEENRFEVSRSRLRKLLGVLLRREFPRSTKVRLYEPGAWDGEGALTTPRKKL